MEYRVELKYLVSDLQIIFLQKQLELLMQYDKHHPNGDPYMVRSLYFDDLYDSCMRENEDSTDYREKFRVRYYNGDFSDIYLETKEKIHGYTRKRKETLSYDQCMTYMNKEAVSPKSGDGFLQKKLYAMMQTSHFQPVQIVEYERMALTEHNGNVRVTFDRNICASKQIETFFDNIIPSIPILPAGIHIMEVKYDEFLPDSVREVLNSVSLNRISFSKYYYSRINEMINWE